MLYSLLKYISVFFFFVSIVSELLKCLSIQYFFSYFSKSDNSESTSERLHMKWRNTEYLIVVFLLYITQFRTNFGQSVESKPDQWKKTKPKLKQGELRSVEWLWGIFNFGVNYSFFLKGQTGGGRRSGFPFIWALLSAIRNLLHGSVIVDLSRCWKFARCQWIPLGILCNGEFSVKTHCTHVIRLSQEIFHREFLRKLPDFFCVGNVHLLNGELMNEYNIS